MEQGIYQGLITHNRTSPTNNKFSYRYAMLFLDLDKIKTLDKYEKPREIIFVSKFKETATGKTIKKESMK